MINAIIQARMGSTRLPHKVMAEIMGKPLLWHVVDRLRDSKYLDLITVATSIAQYDDTIEIWARNNSIKCFRGSEENVLKRYFDAAVSTGSKIIVRITADDPFKDYNIMDSVIEKLIEEKADFACNNYPPSFPEGMDIEVFTMDALQAAFEHSNTSVEQEHVTQYFYNNISQFKTAFLTNQDNISFLRWTVDTEKDLAMTREVYRNLYKPHRKFMIDDILELIKRRPEIADINRNEKRSILYER